MDKKRFPSPHSGILFLSICACTIIIAGCKVSVPSFGDSFFILPVLTLHGGDRRRVSVPSFGDSFFMKLYAVCLVVTLSCFRPLIRGFFFYCHCILLVRLGKRLRFRPLIRGFFFYVGNVPSLVMAHQRVSVPSFGDSFFISSLSRRHESLEYVSVPSFGDSFFIIAAAEKMSCLNLVSVPSFGDSFFIICLSFYFNFTTIDSFRPLIRGFFFYAFIRRLRSFSSADSFPSPHSGILFLSCRYDMPPSLNIFAIFRRILHLLAQKGFPLTQSIHFSPYPSASARIKSFFIHVVPSPIPLNQYIITSSSFISPMPHDLTLV